MLFKLLNSLMGFSATQQAAKPGRLPASGNNDLLDRQLARAVQGMTLREQPTPGRLFFAVELGESTTLAQITQFVATCPPELEATYFDHFHPQLSDPGAYVRVQKTAAGCLLRKLANHGWSSDWNAITVADLAAHILKNRVFQAGNFRVYRRLSEAVENRK